MLASEISVIIQRRMGPMMREVRREEPASVEKPKMTHIQRRTGNQYFRNQAVGFTNEAKEAAQANPRQISAA